MAHAAAPHTVHVAEPHTAHVAEPHTGHVVEPHTAHGAFGRTAHGVIIPPARNNASLKNHTRGQIKARVWNNNARCGITPGPGEARKDQKYLCLLVRNKNDTNVINWIYEHLLI